MAVYKVLGEEILNNAWDGYNCCLFAYGQTGSGKSYSMVGYGANKGIIPIACNEIFKRIERNTNPNMSYEVQVSMLEIYNEKVQDLLIDSSLRPSQGLKIREHKILGPYVEGLTKYPVTTYEEIAKKMDDGGENRTIGSTLMNATSSRAHTIITIEFKQKEANPGKPATEKVSIINLVDLAGSERSSSTGATGSRLKEGCNINKSLLVLGNVINTLADKATGGKNKNMLPPYRDSALTRILQSALGGNSKTVMICAASPADINYEETLSTLRYADRAKKIQNKAVINESDHDKMVRLLKEENMELKKKLDQVLGSISMNGGSIKEEDKVKALEMKDEYEANLKLMESMEKSFTQKLEEAKKNENTLGERVDINKPHLVVINEDPQLSHKLKYGLNALPVHVGRKTGNPKPKIVLSGAGIKVNHAVFEQNQKDKIRLKPTDPQARDYIFINGKTISEEGVILNHMDKIILGNNTFLIYVAGSAGGDIHSIDWELMYNQQQEELDKEQELKEMEKEKEKQAELEMLKKKMEESFSLEKQKMEESLKKQLEEYEARFKSTGVDEKPHIYKKKTSIENILNDEEIVKSIQQRLHINKEKSIFIREGNQSSDVIHSSSKFESTLINLAKKLVKFRSLILKMNRNYHVDLFLNRDIETDLYSISKKDSNEKSIEESLIVLFRVENYEEGEVYYWTSENFNNRYELVNELYEDNSQSFEEGQEVNVSKDQDGLYDIKIQSLMGYSFLSLKPILYLAPTSFITPVFSAINSQINAKLRLSIEITNENDVPLAVNLNPLYEDYHKKTLKITFKLDKLEDIADCYFGNIQIEYYCLGEIRKVITQIDPQQEIVDKSITINHSHSQLFAISSVSDFTYLKEESLVMKVFAIEKTKKLGKLPLRKTKIIEPMKLNHDPEPETKSRSRTVATSKQPLKAAESEEKKKDCIIY